MTVKTTPQIFSCPATSPSETALTEAAAIVREGGLVVFPTETVYGVAVHAENLSAVERLYRIKGRPAEKRLTYHVWNARQIEQLASSVPPVARQLIDTCWPGPLTLILPGRDTPTVGVRLPDHPVARIFLRFCDVPIVAPSANISGQAPPTDAAAAIAAVGAQVDAVIDSGPTTYAHASTVVDATIFPVRLLREGVITRERLLQLGIPLQ